MYCVEDIHCHSCNTQIRHMCIIHVRLHIHGYYIVGFINDYIQYNNTINNLIYIGPRYPTKNSSRIVLYV